MQEIERFRIADAIVPNLDEKLDDALKDTFPASDPFYLAPDEERADRSVQAETPDPCAAPVAKSS